MPNVPVAGSHSLTSAVPTLFPFALSYAMVTLVGSRSAPYSVKGVVPLTRTVSRYVSWLD